MPLPLRPLPLLTSLIAALTLAACGGETDPAGTTTTTPSPTTAETDNAPVDPDTTLIAALGDSYTAGSPLWDPDPDTRAQLGVPPDERSQYEYWATEADPSISFRNCGVWGERTDQILQRFEACTDGADALLVQGGINNIVQGAPIEDAAADLEQMVERGKALGLPVAIADVLPWNNGYPAADPAIKELNAMIADIADRQGIPLIPFYATLDCADAPGRMCADRTDDGNHPNIPGYRELAEQAVLPNLPGSRAGREP